MNQTKLSRIDLIREIEGKGAIEIVSYGLAPNPNGFCYEADRGHEEYSQADERLLNHILDTLTRSEERDLRGQL